MTLPLFGTLSAEPASHDIAQVTAIKGGARAVDFDRAGGFSIDSVSKSGTSQYHGAGELPVPDQRRWRRTSTSGSAVAVRAGPRLARPRTSAARSSRTASSSTARTTGPTNSRTNRANLYGELPDVRQHAQRGLRQADLHARRRSVLLNASYRDSQARRHRATSSPSNASATTGTGNESRLKIVTADGSWVINSRSFVDLQVHPLREPDRRARPDYDRRRRPSPRRRARGSTSTTSTRRAGSPCRRRSAAQTGLQRVRPAPHRPLRLHAERRARSAAASSATAAVRQRRLLPRRRRRSAYNLTLGTSVTHDLHVGYQWYKDVGGPASAARTAGARSPCPGGRLAPVQGHADRVLHRARSSSSPPARRAPIHSEYHSQNFELNDTIKWKNWTFNVGAARSATTRSTARACARTPRPCPATSPRPGNKYKMYEIPFGKMIQPRARRDLGLQRQGHRLRELRALQPGGQLAAARRVVGPQPDRAPSSTRTSTRTACSSRRCRSAPRRASCSCPT